MSKSFFTVLLLLVFQCVSANPMQPDNITATKPATSTNKPIAAKTVRWPALSSVIIIGEYRKAIFSNTWELNLGESRSGFKLISVEADHVVLQYGNTRKQINLSTLGETKITPVVEE